MRKAAWMVVKDEEFYVDMAIQSVMDHVDGLAILDTGSRDRTIQIIEEFKNKYKNKIVLVEKDFGADKEFRFGKTYREAEARNYAQEIAKSFFSPDWLIQLDSDEVYNDRFFEIVDSMDLGKNDCFAHSTDLPTSIETTSSNPADMSIWSGVQLFDPHVRSWAAHLDVKWQYRIGAHVFPRIPGVPGYLETPTRMITTEHIHFHLHRAFGPKCIATYITDFRCAYESASIELKVPLPRIFDQAYFGERWPDWFENGKFKPKKEVLQKLKKNSVLCSLPSFVIDRWKEWGDWSNW